jgi:hypothetical protein
MATWESSAASPLYPTPVQCITIDAMAAARNYYFKPARRWEIVSLDYSADACDGTDFTTVILSNVTTSDTILTGATFQTADTVVQNTTVDSGKSSILLPGHTYKIALTAPATPANVKGVTVRLWAKPASHE